MGARVVWLDALAEDSSVAVAGAKAANLAAMVRAGLPVPPGFVVTTDAFAEFMHANALHSRILEFGDASRSGNTSEPEARVRRLRSLFDSGSLSEGVKQDILGGYRRLAEDSPTSDPPVAVRSSATVEDLSAASFAGGQDTYLNVQGETALLRAVRHCWAGFWSERADVYLRQRQIDPATASLAVVVQLMVPSEVAGVLFTLNPVTGNRGEVIINAAWGLGESVVGGRVTPDHIVVDKATRRVAALTIADKEVMTVPTTDGIADHPVEAERRRRPVLGAEQIERLLQLAGKVEAHFGSPQDIEWAVARGEVHVLQSRPVTAIPPSIRTAGGVLPAPGDDDWPALDERPPHDWDLWTHVNVGEIWPHPVTPLMWSAVPFVVGTATRYGLRALKSRHLAQTQWARRIYGRAYYNEGAFAHVLSHELGLPASFVDAAVGSRRGPSVYPGGPVRVTRLIRHVPFLVQIVVSQLRSGRTLDALFPQVDRDVSYFMKRRLSDQSDKELWDELALFVDRFIHTMNVNTELSISAMAAFGLLQDLTIRWCDREDLAHDLVAGLSGIHSAEMGSALWQLARSLSGAGLTSLVLEQEAQAALSALHRTPAARPFLETFDAFLERHGHHCPNEGEWLYPRWIEAPEQVIDVIAGYLRAGDRIDPVRAEAEQRGRRAAAVGWAHSHLSALRWAIFRRVLARTQQLVRLRENGKNCYVRAFYPVRRFYALFGERFAAREWLSRPDDIFFLTMPEVERIVQSGDPASAGVDLPTLIRERRKAFEYWFTVDAPDVVGADLLPYAVPAPVEGSTDVLEGIPVSGGVVRGTVRVIDDPAGAHLLQSGEILVTRATDPGWTSLFPLIAGVVVEIGGQLSHAAIVAREYGVPAVANVRHATRRLRNGQVVTLDGTTGRIHVGTTSGS